MYPFTKKFIKVLGIWFKQKWRNFTCSCRWICYWLENIHNTICGYKLYCTTSFFTIRRR